ncbi:flocculation protein FLO11-like [Teleopsis dalmanni]|uniref:flocculation protein FLO11 n=1 Tax=Teleopsis dalmanni TaxID=139649 RepID=UPI0018CFE40D|nr:flocculation protein FLO11 [Teleopsis dalmanni]XP_037944782.1 flocculation protein FLO11-like [Teleopsis dalmanni]
MPIQLDVILKDISEEKVLHPNYPTPSKKEVDDAWARVSKKNVLSVHEARSIFKVLQRKYEQERVKPTSSWKLFKIMEIIHTKIEEKPEEKHDEDPGTATEEDEEYEMLEVQEDEEQPVNTSHNTGSSSDNETSKHKVNDGNKSPEKDEKPQRKSSSYTTKSFSVTSAPASSSNTNTISQTEEKKLLNIMASSSPRPPLSQTTNVTVAALNKKGITMKKTSVSSAAISKAQTTTTGVQVKNSSGRMGLLEVGKTIQMPESLKRKLSQEQNAIQVKKLNLNTTQSTNISPSSKTASQATNPITSQYVQVKQEREDTEPHNINLITIPANPSRNDITNGLVSGNTPCSSTAATVATSSNGFSSHLEDIDYKNDIIFDVGSGINTTNLTKINTANPAAEIINFGNFDNSLPPTFFKNLCNSSRHEALGLYLANIMNRISERAAAKLELAVLRSIIDIQSEELEQ